MDAGLKTLSVALAGLLLSGCAQMGYYAHLARGQMELLSRREPIAKIIEDPSRDADLRRRLGLVLDARRFAIDALKLPDNPSYTLYADLDRPYVIWNVYATPEFSLRPVESCFPISGCVAYRGHYDKARAQKQAQGLKDEGFDVDIGGVPAYSTLGWFDDPVLNTMMHWSDAVLIGTVFHELGHQRLYVKDDTVFNESYASFIEQEGVRQYFGSGRADEEQSSAQRRRESEFVHLVLDARKRLGELYQLPLSPEVMREKKAEAFAQLQADYARVRDTHWNGDTGYNGWFARELNNASLLPVGLYDEWVPAFAALFAQSDHDWARFHAACAQLGKLDAAARKTRLVELQGGNPVVH